MEDTGAEERYVAVGSNGLIVRSGAEMLSGVVQNFRVLSTFSYFSEFLCVSSSNHFNYRCELARGTEVIVARSVSPLRRAPRTTHRTLPHGRSMIGQVI